MPDRLSNVTIAGLVGTLSAIAAIFYGGLRVVFSVKAQRRADEIQGALDDSKLDNKKMKAELRIVALETGQAALTNQFAACQVDHHESRDKIFKKLDALGQGIARIEGKMEGIHEAGN